MVLLFFLYSFLCKYDQYALTCPFILLDECFLHLFRKKGIHFVSIDETHPLSEQGPFDIILHKVRKLVFLLRWYCSFGYLLFLTPSILTRQTSVLIIPFTPVIRFSLWKPAVNLVTLRCPRQGTLVQRACKWVHVVDDWIPTRGME